MRRRVAFCSFFVLAASWLATAAAPRDAEALVFLLGDQHSAYERTAQVVQVIDRERAAHPHLPIAILIDGDVFEYRNALARRSGGVIDFAMLGAFARRVPTILNLGNHEPEFYDLAETIRRAEAAGVMIVSNITNRSTGKPYAPDWRMLRLGSTDAVVVGLTTDRLAAFREAVQPALDLANPVAWGKQHLPKLLATAAVRIVLSHAGLRADRELLPLVPQGTLFVGAHDHLRFVHHAGRTIYVQSGSWNECVSEAWLRRDGSGQPMWEVEQLAISPGDPGDPQIAAVIHATEVKYLTPADRAVVGHTEHAYPPADAARFVVDALRRAAQVDAAFVGHTTFGGGLPAGDVTRLAFDGCVRFDDTLWIGECDGSLLRRLLASANQTPDTPWPERRGDYLVASGPTDVLPDRRYRIAVPTWIARNPMPYLETDAVRFVEHPKLQVKAIVLEALQKR